MIHVVKLPPRANIVTIFANLCRLPLPFTVFLERYPIQALLLRCHHRRLHPFVVSFGITRVSSAEARGLPLTDRLGWLVRSRIFRTSELQASPTGIRVDVLVICPSLLIAIILSSLTSTEYIASSIYFLTIKLFFIASFILALRLWPTSVSLTSVSISSLRRRS